jgi:ribonuclease H / adenosylcobalamin/alpha-ribazole phosphatase
VASGTILLARHGSHDELGRVLSGRSEIALNAAGRAEAEALAEMLAGLAGDSAVATLHTSPRLRTRQTAEPVAQALGRVAVVAPALDEIDFGAFAGRPFAELDAEPAWHRWNAERATARCPGGETMAEAVGRMAEWIDRLPADAFPTVLVTHCDLIRGLVATRMGMGLQRLLDLSCDPGSLTVLEWGEPTRLRMLNRQVRR